MTWSKYMHNPSTAPTADRLRAAFNDSLSKTKEGPLTKREATWWSKSFKDAAGDPDDADDILSMFNKRLNAYGIEAIRGEHQVDNYYYDIVGLYVNTGDTYNATVVYDTERERFEVTTFGDWVEKNQKRYNII